MEGCELIGIGPRHRFTVARRDSPWSFVCHCLVHIGKSQIRPNEIKNQTPRKNLLASVPLKNWVSFSEVPPLFSGELRSSEMKPPLRQVSRNSPRNGGLVRRQAGTAARQGNRTVTDVGSASAEVHSSNIRVAVRVRPLNDRENSGNAKYDHLHSLPSCILLHYFLVLFYIILLYVIKLTCQKIITEDNNWATYMYLNYSTLLITVLNQRKNKTISLNLCMFNLVFNQICSWVSNLSEILTN